MYKFLFHNDRPLCQVIIEKDLTWLSNGQSKKDIPYTQGHRGGQKYGMHILMYYYTQEQRPGKEIIRESVEEKRMDIYILNTLKLIGNRFINFYPIYKHGYQSAICL